MRICGLDLTRAKTRATIPGETLTSTPSPARGTATKSPTFGLQVLMGKTAPKMTFTTNNACHKSESVRVRLRRERRRTVRRAGFTLMELMLVLAILVGI